MFMDSIQPRKQRKFRYNAPLHLRRKMVGVHVSKELRAKLGTRRRSVTVHKGDRVRLMRGDKKGHTGKVIEVDLADLKVYVEGVTHRNAKGIEKLIPLDPSNLLLMEGEFIKDRLAMLERSPKAVMAQPKK
jgi:large subunit ribosomal protein L24